MRGRSYSLSPPRGRYGGRRGRSPSPRGRYGSRDRDLPTSLLVRNLRHDCRPEDLRRPFGQFGALKDVYLPKDYYTGEPRGFGFVQFVDPADAAEAKYQMDGQILLGRELTVVFAEENRKKPVEMRQRGRGSSYVAVSILFPRLGLDPYFKSKIHCLVAGHDIMIEGGLPLVIQDHQPAMKGQGLAAVIIIPLLKEGIIRDLFHRKIKGLVERDMCTMTMIGHTHDLQATRAQVEGGAQSEAGAQAEAGAGAGAQVLIQKYT